MLTTRRSAASLLLLVVACCAALAQTEKVKASGAPTVTVALSEKGVRLTALGNVGQMRLEVFDAAGAPVSDTGFQPGNVRDWSPPDKQPLADGTYQLVVTMRDLSGRLSLKQCAVAVQAGRAALELGEAEPAGGAEPDDRPSAAPASADTAMTLLAHDGASGQVARTRGALRFTVGDFFAGREREQMRLTEEGNLGLGTSEPRARLDVAGDIRASGAINAAGGVRFDDGTALTSAGHAARVNPDGTLSPAASGAGTQNRLAKWKDDAGTLTDSALYESGGQVGLGTPSPASLLHLSGPSGVAAITFDTPGSQRFRFQTVPGTPNWGALTLNSNYFYPSGWLLDDATTNGYFFKLDTRGGNAAGVNNGLWLYRVPAGAGFHTDESPLFGVSNGIAFFAGNVGIGTPTPGALLDVAGAINTSTQFNIGGIRVLSVTGGGSNANTNTFVGVNAGASTMPSGTNAFGNLNSFFGESAGYNNQTGFLNSFFGIDAGYSNSTGSQNTYLGAGANSTDGLTNATAVGSNAFVTQANSLILGSINGLNAATANTSVGIGTPAPAYPLTVSGSAGTNQNQGVVEFNSPSSVNDTGLRLNNTAAGGRVYTLFSSGGASGVGVGNFTIFDAAANLSRLSVTPTGNVGIGTPAPTARLTVSTNTTNSGENTATFQALNIGANKSHIHYGVTGDWYIRSAASTGKVILQDGGGSVGIGTSDPHERLQVQSGNIYVGSPGQGIILKSPDGTKCALFTINNSGVLTTTGITCP